MTTPRVPDQHEESPPAKRRWAWRTRPIIKVIVLPAVESSLNTDIR